jgi:hypothetical protein
MIIFICRIPTFGSGGTRKGAHRRAAKGKLFGPSPSANLAGIGEKNPPEVSGRLFSQYEPPEDLSLKNLIPPSEIATP